MNYITLLNAFERCAMEYTLSSTAELLWYKLVGVWNKTRWRECFRVDNRRLMDLLKTRSEHTLIKARQMLIDAGLLEYQSGTKGIPGSYRMLTPFFQRPNRMTFDLPDPSDVKAWQEMEARLLMQTDEFEHEKKNLNPENQKICPEKNSGEPKDELTKCKSKTMNIPTSKECIEVIPMEPDENCEIIPLENDEKIEETVQIVPETKAELSENEQITVGGPKDGLTKCKYKMSEEKGGLTKCKYKMIGKKAFTAKSADINKLRNIDNTILKYSKYSNRGMASSTYYKKYKGTKFLKDGIMSKEIPETKENQNQWSKDIHMTEIDTIKNQGGISYEKDISNTINIGDAGSNSPSLRSGFFRGALRAFRRFLCRTDG